MFTRFEQGSNDYQRLERPSTCLHRLANCLDLLREGALDYGCYLDVTLLGRAAAHRTTEGADFAKNLATQTGARWSYATVEDRTFTCDLRGLSGSVSLPNVQKLTTREKENLAVSLQNSNYCRRKTGNDVIDFLCYDDKEKFERGGDYEYHPDWLEYLAPNVGVAAATFASVFGLAFLVPILIHGLAFLARRYWEWLNA